MMLCAAATVPVMVSVIVASLAGYHRIDFGTVSSFFVTDVAKVFICNLIILLSPGLVGLVMAVGLWFIERQMGWSKQRVLLIAAWFIPVSYTHLTLPTNREV